jgi:hypothetical protein
MKTKATVIFLIALGLGQPFLTSSKAQFNIRIGGRGGNFQFNVPNGAINELFKPSILKFQESVLKNDVERAERWVKPEYVNTPIKGYPPVYYAAARGETDMLDMLTKHGARVSRKFDGKSLAYVAAANGHPNTAEALVDMGGGTSNDIARGRVLYAENSARQRKEQQVMTAVGLSFLAAAIQDSMRTHYYRDEYGNIYHD